MHRAGAGYSGRKDKMNNLDIWEKGREVPETAKKPIQGGRLSGMTDINPVWRIKKLTELFGICGIGWKTDDVFLTQIEGANGEVMAQVNLKLCIKVDGEWSAPIFGTGGSLLIAQERGGARTNDEAWKMAYTDALSVACKMLGIGADVYFAKDATKYTGMRPEASPAGQKPAPPQKTENNTTQKEKPSDGLIAPAQLKELASLCIRDGQKDQKLVDELRMVYQSKGYKFANEIKIKDFDMIKKAMSDAREPDDSLPFEL